MNIFKMKWHRIGIFLVALLFVTACDLDVTNPNTATEEEVVTSTEGIINLATGIQQYHATSFLETVVADPGLTTHELSRTTTLANYIEMEIGGFDLPTANANVLRLWSRPLRLIQMAEQLTAGAQNVDFEHPGTRSGILALANFHKAAALGALAQNFESAPMETDVGENALFSDREDLLIEAVTLLDEALDLLDAEPQSDLFDSRILGDAFDLTNTLHAYKARFLLMAGRYDEAYAAANEVDPNTTSYFSLDTQNRNPVYNIFSSAGLEYVAPRENFGTDLTEDGDARIDFYLSGDVRESSAGEDIRDLAGFFGTASSDIPAYLIGEMMLIQAEVVARSDNPADAIPYINDVRTKSADDDPYGVGADLLPYIGDLDQESLLEEIYRQRTAELFLSGLRLEDSRRLGRDGPLDGDPERTRNFYPYPDQERLNNDNTPTNPEI